MFYLIKVFLLVQESLIQNSLPGILMLGISRPVYARLSDFFVIVRSFPNFKFCSSSWLK